MLRKTVTAQTGRTPPQRAGNRGRRHVLTRTQQRHTVAACFLSWTLDAFDFFIMVFVLADIAKDFESRYAAAAVDAARATKIRRYFDSAHQRLRLELASLGRRSNLGTLPSLWSQP